MGITNANKEVFPDKINCGGSFKVKISLTAEPEIMSNPVDIVLVLDRSNSMAGSPLTSLKAGARKFIDIIAEATDGAQTGQIGYGSRIGIVSFADTATEDTGLITSVEDLKMAVNALTAGGRTNHADAFTKAVEMFPAGTTNERVIVMFTDGRTTVGPDAEPVAAAAKEQGIIIYAIGYTGNGGIDEDALKSWASKPSSTYVAIAPDEEKLEEIFEDLAKNIAKPGAENIVVDEKVKSCFKITALDPPSKGSATITGDTTLQWKIDKLGEKAKETATLEFTVEHVGPCTGLVEVNEEIKYTDKEGHKVTFPSPKIDVECGDVVIQKGCPTAKDATVAGCQDAITFNAGDVVLEDLGRIASVDVTIKNVCPHKRVALAVIITETDAAGKEHKRGVKIMTIPAHTQSGCRDVQVKCIKFVLPEDLDVTGGMDGICDERRFKVRVLANYVDDDFICCGVIG